MILLKIRGSCISYASFKKKEETRLENEIMSIIKHLEDNLNENNVHQLEEKRQELIELRKKKVDGMIVRPRAKWIYEGEQNSKYFCNLEKRHFVQKAMCFIQKDDGDIIHDSNLITQEVKTFYENLYASRENNIVHCNIDNINTPTLSQEESDSLEGPITLQEALSSIKQMKNDKSPGSDGFTAEFNKKKKKSFSQTWVHLWFALLTMGSTVAKCRSRRDKGLLFVYPRKEKINNF